MRRRPPPSSRANRLLASGEDRACTGLDTGHWTGTGLDSSEHRGQNTGQRREQRRQYREQRECREQREYREQRFSRDTSSSLQEGGGETGEGSLENVLTVDWESHEQEEVEEEEVEEEEVEEEITHHAVTKEQFKVTAITFDVAVEHLV